MFGYKRISRQARESLEAAIRDCDLHVQRGRACHIEELRPSKTSPTTRYMAYVQAAPDRRLTNTSGRWHAPLPGQDTMMRYRVADADPRGAFIDLPNGDRVTA